MTRKLAMVLAGSSLASAMALTGCGTVAGIGQDISATGQAVTNVASYEAPPPRVYDCDRYYYDRFGNRHCY